MHQFSERKTKTERQTWSLMWGHDGSETTEGVLATWGLLFCPEEGGNIFLRNVHIYICTYCSHSSYTRGLTILFTVNSYLVKLRHNVYLKPCQIDVVKQPKTEPLVNQADYLSGIKHDISSLGTKYEFAWSICMSDLSAVLFSVSTL